MLVAVRLTGLREENQRSGVGGLRGEGEVQQDERVRVERLEQELAGVQRDPERDEDRLADDEPGRAEEARETLGGPPEGIAAKGASVVRMRPLDHGHRFDIHSGRPSAQTAQPGSDTALFGSIRIFACSSASASTSKARSTPSSPTVPVTTGPASTRPSASMCRVSRNSSGE